MKKILTIFTVIVLVGIIVGCGKKTESKSLKITIFLGGYGQVWANTLARGFEEENPGVTVTIEANPNLPSEIPARLENGSDDDIFFSHGLSWQKFAVQDYLEPLDDLYNQEVKEGVTFESAILNNYLPASKFNGHYYKVPWTNGAGGLVYNAKMFRDNGWDVPTTYQELVNLCATIDAANIKVDPNDMKPNAPTVKPFIWSSENYYWDYLVFDWWGQLAGIDKINEFKRLESTDIFDPNKNPELMNAFGAWVDLVAKQPDYSVEDSVGKQYMAAQMDFLNGYAAMMPNAQWLESEMRDNIDPSIMDMRLMPTPFLEGAKKDENGNPIRINYAVGGGDSIIIPKNAPHKDLAKKFLLYMAREENMIKFTELTNGVMLAMNYPDNATIPGASEFAKSVMEINQNSVKFDLDSQNPLYLDGKISVQWAPDGLTPYANYFNHYNTQDYLENPSSYPEKPVIEIFTSKYNDILQEWERLNDELVN